MVYIEILSKANVILILDHDCNLSDFEGGFIIGTWMTGASVTVQLFFFNRNSD